MNPRTVIRALVDLDYERDNVSVKDVAAYLKAPEDEIALAVSELEEARIVKRPVGFIRPWGG